MVEFAYPSHVEGADRGGGQCEFCLNQFDERPNDTAVHKIRGVSVVADKDATIFVKRAYFWVVRWSAIRNQFAIDLRSHRRPTLL